MVEQAHAQKTVVRGRRPVDSALAIPL